MFDRLACKDKERKRQRIFHKDNRSIRNFRILFLDIKETNLVDNF